MADQKQVGQLEHTYSSSVRIRDVALKTLLDDKVPILLDINFSLFRIPSPDLNPLDYFICSYVENITNMTSHNTKASPIAAIRRVFAELPPALVEKACSQFRIRIAAVIEAIGGYIE